MPLPLSLTVTAQATVMVTVTETSTATVTVTVTVASTVTVTVTTMDQWTRGLMTRGNDTTRNMGCSGCQIALTRRSCPRPRNPTECHTGGGAGKGDPPPLLRTLVTVVCSLSSFLLLFPS